MRTFSHLPDLGNGQTHVGRGLRVLIADDERDTVLTLGILLRSEGFEVLTTTNGTEVPRAVQDFKPDFVLLDIGMPDRTGYELAEELRASYGNDCPFLIAVTAYATRLDKVHARRVGFHHHIGKPYNPVALIHLLKVLKARPDSAPEAN